MSDGTPPPENPNPPGGSTPPGPPPAEEPAPAAPSSSTPPPSAPQGGAYGQPTGGYGAPAAPAGAMNPVLARFLARLIDGILIGVVNAIIISVIIVGAIGLNGASAFGTYGGSYAGGLVGAVIGVAINLGYFAFMESSQGRTLGKMALKLRVRGASGGNPTMEESVKRNWWLALPLLAVIPIFGGLIGSLIELVVIILIAVQINSDPERRPQLSDRFAGTQVLQEG